MTVCPCCGFRFEGDLSEGCQACGARSVGPPLPRPQHELPAYGRSLLLAITGSLMVLVFIVETIIALAQRNPLSFDFWSWIAAGETAAWRLKWIAIPVSMLVLWSSRSIYRSMLKTPARFCGLHYARTGLVASTSVPLIIAFLIGVTVPERLIQRQLSIEAGDRAILYAIALAQAEYQIQFKSFPSDMEKGLGMLPDPDGSISAALRKLDPASLRSYKTSSELAALPKQKPQTLRGAVIRNASVDAETDDMLSEGLSSTSYEFRWRGPDKIMGTDDDLLVRDGIVLKASETPKGPNTSSASDSKANP